MNYVAIIEKTIEYIEQHLEEELIVENIAEEAGYSIYHLTHIFTNVIGEPIGSYIKRRRLANSCKKLLYTKKRIIDIAIESHFGSSEAFSRSFKSVFGVSPAVYRKNNVDLYISSKKKLDKESLQHLAGITVKPRLVEIDNILVAGIRDTFAQYNTLPALWYRFHEICSQIPAPPDARRLGICETDRTKVSLSKDGNVVFSELVGMEVDDFQHMPEGIACKIISGGRYAVFTHRGTIATLIKTYDYIWSSWVLFTKEILDDREDFEIYDERFLGEYHPDSQIDIYIPII